MRRKLTYVCMVALALICAIRSAGAQAVYAAHQGNPTLDAGGGISLFSVDKAGGESNPILGPTLWVDWRPPIISHVISGLGIEGEGRILLWNRGDVTNFKEYSIGGGPIYHPGMFRFHGMRPYVKGVINYGYVDTTPVPIPGQSIHHWDSVTYGFGAGIDYPLTSRIALRGDYQYQFWPNYPRRPNLKQTANPNGVTIGAIYSFGGRFK